MATFKDTKGDLGAKRQEEAKSQKSFKKTGAIERSGFNSEVREWWLEDAKMADKMPGYLKQRMRGIKENESTEMEFGKVPTPDKSLMPGEIGERDALYE
jgi:hypothetical protein